MKSKKRAVKRKPASKPKTRKGKIGGFLPALIPIIAAIIGGAGAIASGGASIASAVNKAKANEKLLAEAKRHNLVMEGKGLKKRKCVGKGLYLKPQKV